jgi:hypothetical protein
VIVVRHGATFPDQADTDPLNFDNMTKLKISAKNGPFPMQRRHATLQKLQPLRNQFA